MTKTRTAKPAAINTPGNLSPIAPVVEESYIRVAEGAALLAVPENTLYKMALARRVPSYKIGKIRLFRRSELIAFAASHRVNPAD